MSKTSRLSLFLGIIFCGLCVDAVFISPVYGQGLDPNRTKISLWPDTAPGSKGEGDKHQPSLTIYAPEPKKSNGCAIVVCPGGGYGGLALGHEGDAIGKWLSSFGVTAFILKYRHAPHYKHPIPLKDAQRALRTVRAGAKRWNIDPERVGILGFSAGGHLASTAGTHFDFGNPDTKDVTEKQSSRPDFLVLLYPVISFTTEYTHKGSRRNLLGDSPDPQLVKYLSSELQVTKNTPPTFLFHTTEDQAVPVENSVLFYLALQKAGVRGEMHVYQPGRHGVGLAKSDPVLSTWPKLCENWLKSEGFLAEKNR